MCVRVDERDIAVSAQEHAGPQQDRRNFPGSGGRMAFTANAAQLAGLPSPLQLGRQD